ncbi:MAG: DUF2306 domain-containing protein [Emcibacteraceae bacterium]|nr:DUF2306 domain-containing protein [Emcibacteraceae bacterium]MDG1858724.1 DUF2306 domain-containing protein [Emcibacteraceae bacterium]
MSFISYVANWAQTDIGYFHLICSLTGLLVGLLLFVMGKATQKHKIFGYLFVTVMILTNCTALISYNLTGGFNLFHFFALISLGTVLLAFYYIRRAIKTHNKSAYIAHGVMMSWTYFGLVAAFLSEYFTRRFPETLQDTQGWMMFTVGLIVFFLTAGTVTHKIISKKVPDIVQKIL